MSGMTDARAGVVLDCVSHLAIVVRDEGPEEVAKQLARVEAAAGGDLRAALVIACALIDVDGKLNAWWQDGTAGTLRPCGTPAAARRHSRRGEPLDDACLEARRAMNREKTATARAEGRKARTTRRKAAA